MVLPGLCTNKVLVEHFLSTFPWLLASDVLGDLHLVNLLFLTKQWALFSKCYFWPLPSGRLLALFSTVPI